ncbi:replication protein A 70 kDa DNA-binding subunit B-like isoform X3 [Miscanthus floridulus]|uniref:replication protein A 70 kDa DNA-binding subunit B-like isoform X3 n=1 Tax=Miscanthus floridulus TaxID=154761 RepID=UPI00345A8DD2
MQQPRFLSNLQKSHHAQGITTRVIRKWTHYENMGQGPPLYVGMVLADARGHAVYAEISNDLIKSKASLFEVGKVYIIKKFLVDSAKKSYRPVDKDLMIEMAAQTTLEVVQNPPQTIPEYIYRITQFPAIKPTRMVYNLTDVIGYLVKYEATHTFVPKNQEKAKTLREIYIKDLRINSHPETI